MQIQPERENMDWCSNVNSAHNACYHSLQVFTHCSCAGGESKHPSITMVMIIKIIPFLVEFVARSTIFCDRQSCQHCGLEPCKQEAQKPL